MTGKADFVSYSGSSIVVRNTPECVAEANTLRSNQTSLVAKETDYYNRLVADVNQFNRSYGSGQPTAVVMYHELVPPAAWGQDAQAQVLVHQVQVVGGRQADVVVSATSYKLSENPYWSDDALANLSHGCNATAEAKTAAMVKSARTLESQAAHIDSATEQRRPTPAEVTQLQQIVTKLQDAAKRADAVATEAELARQDGDQPLPSRVDANTLAALRFECEDRLRKVQSRA